MSSRLIKRFLLQHQDWITEKQKTIPPSIPFEDGALIPIFGNETRIQITHNTDLKRTTLALKDNILNVKTYLDDPTSRIQRFLKKEASLRYHALALHKAKNSRKKLTSLTVRDTKSRWGSCSTDGRLSLSSRLIFAPVEAMDYVIAHEIAHLTHMNHSPAFWRLCKSLCENYTEGKSWMKAHGHTLMRYGR